MLAEIRWEAQSFFEYYDSREWKNKHGDITKWRPVATAWFNRSAALKNYYI